MPMSAQCSYSTLHQPVSYCMNENNRWSLHCLRKGSVKVCSPWCGEWPMRRRRKERGGRRGAVRGVPHGV